MTKKRQVMRVELTGPAKAKLDELSDHTGMTQVALTSRLVEWFTTQPDLIQAAVLGRYPAEIQAEVGKLILSRMFGAEPKSDGATSERDER